MNYGRKQISFDLDINALKLYYPSPSYNNAYEVIKRHMLKNGFYWLQGSVYISKKPILSSEVTAILDELSVKNSWLNKCMRDCRETNIGKEHNKNYVFSNKRVPTKE